MTRLPHLHTKTGTSKSGKTWTAYYHVTTVDGKAKWTSLGTNRLLAVRKWAELEKLPAPSETGTFNAVADQYMEWAKVRVTQGLMAQRTVDDREVYLKQLRPVFGDKPFDAIQPKVVVAYLDKRSAKIVGKKEMRFLSAMWNWARERGITTLANPVAGVKMVQEVGRSIVVRPQDYWLVWQCGDQLVRDVLELAARLATRPQEVFGLTWDRVNLAATPRTVEVWQNKVKEFRTVVADDGLDEILERLRADRDRPKGHVLTEGDGAPLRPTGAFRYRFDKARADAAKKAVELGVDFVSFQLRDIRPMAGIATLQAEGMDAARRLLGHKTEKMTSGYTTRRMGMVSNSAPLRSSSKTSQDISLEGDASA